MPFNKSNLIAQVATQTSSTKASAARVIDAVFSSITQALKEGKEVRLIGFGTFIVKDKPALQGRNPRTGEPLHIAASRKPSFRAGLELKNAVNGGS